MSEISVLAQQHAWTNSLQDLALRSLGVESSLIQSFLLGLRQ